MAGLFLTATGTGIGKTLLAEHLIARERAAGRPVRALKPVISGYRAEDPESDTARILRALGGEMRAEEISPWRFAAPLSPDMAAAREGRSIDFAGLTGWCKARMSGPGLTLIEGVGGAFVPLDPEHLVADWIAALGCPFLLAVGGYLGTLSHTLACVEALAARRLVPASVILCPSPEMPVPVEETAAALAARLAMPVRMFGEDLPL